MYKQQWLVREERQRSEAELLVKFMAMSKVGQKQGQAEVQGQKQGRGGHGHGAGQQRHHAECVLLSLLAGNLQPGAGNIGKGEYGCGGGEKQH